jgi:hypothetical protein
MTAHDELREWLARLVACGEAPLGPVDDDLAALIRRTRVTWLAVASGARHPLFDDVARDVFVRGTLLQRVAVAHVQRLAAAGVPSVTLKGPAFAVQILGDAAARETSDVDLLVQRRDLPRVRTVFAAAGMTDAVTYPVWYEERWHDHAAFTRAPGSEPVILEVHWDVVRPGLSRLDVGEVLAGAQTIDCGAARLPAPTLPWQLVIAAAHAAQHYFDGRGVLDVALAGRVLDASGQGQAMEVARRSRLGPALYYASVLASAWLGWTPPAGVESLRPGRVRDGLVSAWLRDWRPDVGLTWRRLQMNKLVAPLSISGRLGGLAGLAYSVTDRPNVCAALDARVRAVRTARH